MKRPAELKLAICLALLALNVTAGAQTNYNLQQLLQEGQLITVSSHETKILEDNKKEAITTKGIVWLKGVTFKQGIIDIDLRGKNVFLKSFLGIAFHGIDTITCDILYFRPFNFRHEDTLRR